MKSQLEPVTWTQFFSETCALRKEFVTEKMFFDYNGVWRPALNYEHLLRAKARERGLKPAEVLEQLALFQYESKQKEFLINTPEWDGFDRIGEVLKFMKLKNFDHFDFSEIFKDWCVKMIARAHDSTVQNRCLIFKGAQGKGKDTFIRSIFGHFDRYLGKYTNSNFQEKDQWELVATKMMVHVEEFEQTNKMSIAFFKNLISADRADFRPPYARDSDSFRCIASFISSSNIDDMLRDTTGNRRFVVFDVESIEWAYPKDWSPQIVAQCFALWRDKWKPAVDIVKLTTESLKGFEPVDTESEMLEDWDTIVTKPRLGKRAGTLKLEDVASEIDEICKRFGVTKQQVFRALRKRGASKNTKHGTFYGTLGHFHSKEVSTPTPNQPPVSISN